MPLSNGSSSPRPSITSAGDWAATSAPWANSTPEGSGSMPTTRPPGVARAIRSVSAASPQPTSITSAGWRAVTSSTNHEYSACSRAE